MTMIAYALLQSRRFKAAGRKKGPRAADPTHNAAIRQAHSTSSHDLRLYEARIVKCSSLRGRKPKVPK